MARDGHIYSPTSQKDVEKQLKLTISRPFKPCITRKSRALGALDPLLLLSLLG